VIEGREDYKEFVNTKLLNASRNPKAPTPMIAKPANFQIFQTPVPSSKLRKQSTKISSEHQDQINVHFPFPRSLWDMMRRADNQRQERRGLLAARNQNLRNSVPLKMLLIKVQHFLYIPTVIASHQRRKPLQLIACISQF